MQTPKGFVSLLLLLVVILASVGGLFYYGVTNGYLLKTTDPNLDVTRNFDEQLTPNTTIPSNTPTISKTTDSVPVILYPGKNERITSPLTVKGIAPPSWFFEGQFVLKLLDNSRKTIVQSAGTEVTPGSWMQDKPVNFEGTLNFSTTAKSGFLVIENDNPSGLPQNQKSYEIPVTF